MDVLKRCRLVWFCLAVWPTLAGCGGNSYSLAPVSGQVTLDGVPLADANLGFEPRAAGDSVHAGFGSYAQTDAEGRYTLSTIHRDGGAVVGSHDVWIRSPQGAKHLPLRYNYETILSFVVSPKGSDEANFDLTSE